MKLYIDTNDCETMFLEMTDEEKDSGVSKSANELIFGLVGLTIDYLQQMDHAFTPEDYHKVRELLVRLFDVKLKNIIDEVLLDDDGDLDLDEEIENLRSMMEATGNFTTDEIAAITKLVIDAGSVDAAMEHLRNLAKEKGIDLGDEY